MTTVETKIEMFVEAVEALTLAQVVATSPACDDHEREIAMKNIVDARACLSTAFREVMTPTLRVLNGPGATPVERVPYGGAGIEGMHLA